MALIAPVGAPLVSALQSTTSVTSAHRQTPTSGNLVLILVQSTRSGSTPTCTTPTNWTAISGASNTANNSTNFDGCFWFYRICDGTANDNAPTFTVGSGQSTYTQTVEYPGGTNGFDTANPGTLIEASNVGSATTTTVTSGNVITTYPRCQVFAGMTERAGSSPTLTPNNSFTIQGAKTFSSPNVIAMYELSVTSAGTYVGSVSFSVAQIAVLGAFAVRLSPVNVNMAGPVATVTVAAPAGSVSAVANVTLTGAVAPDVLAAPAGSVTAGVSVTVAGAVAAMAIAGLAGTVTAQQNSTVTGQTSAVAVGAPAGAVTVTSDVTLTGPAVNIPFTSPAGSVSAGGSVAVTGPVSAVSVTSPAGGVSTTSTVTVNGVVVPFTLTAPAGGVTAGAGVTVAGSTTGTVLTSLAGTVTASTNVNVTGTSTGLAAAAPSGSVTATANVTLAGAAAPVTVTATAGAVRFDQPTPAERRSTLDRADRTLPVPSSPRSLTVQPVNRTDTVEAV